MALTSTEKLQEAFSLALEERSQGYADLVSNSNAIIDIKKPSILMSCNSHDFLILSL